MKAPVGDTECESGVRLRPLRRDDLPMTLAWRNRDDVRIWFKTAAPLTLEQHTAWFERYSGKPGDHVFIVECDGRAVGQAAIYAIDAAQGSAEVGRFIAAPGEAGKGHMRAAISGLVALARREWGLRRLRLEVLAENERALRLYRKFGFAVDAASGAMLLMSMRIDR